MVKFDEKKTHAKEIVSEIKRKRWMEKKEKEKRAIDRYIKDN